MLAERLREIRREFVTTPLTSDDEWYVYNQHYAYMDMVINAMNTAVYRMPAIYETFDNHSVVIQCAFVVRGFETAIVYFIRFNRPEATGIHVGTMIAIENEFNELVGWLREYAGYDA